MSKKSKKILRERLVWLTRIWFMLSGTHGQLRRRRQWISPQTIDAIKKAMEQIEEDSKSIAIELHARK